MAEVESVRKTRKKKTTTPKKQVHATGQNCVIIYSSHIKYNLLQIYSTGWQIKNAFVPSAQHSLHIDAVSQKPLFETEANDVNYNDMATHQQCLFLSRSTCSLLSFPPNEINLI